MLRTATQGPTPCRASGSNVNDQQPEEHRPPRGDPLDQLPGGEQREELPMGMPRSAIAAPRGAARVSCTSGMRGTQFAAHGLQEEHRMTEPGGREEGADHWGKGRELGWGDDRRKTRLLSYPWHEVASKVVSPSIVK